MPEGACSYVRQLGLTLRQIVVFFGVLPDMRAVKCLGDLVSCCKSEQRIVNCDMFALRCHAGELLNGEVFRLKYIQSGILSIHVERAGTTYVGAIHRSSHLCWCTLFLGVCLSAK